MSRLCLGRFEHSWAYRAATSELPAPHHWCAVCGKRLLAEPPAEQSSGMPKGDEL